MNIRKKINVDSYSAPEMRVIFLQLLDRIEALESTTPTLRPCKWETESIDIDAEGCPKVPIVHEGWFHMLTQDGDIMVEDGDGRLYWTHHKHDSFRFTDREPPNEAPREEET